MESKKCTAYNPETDGQPRQDTEAFARLSAILDTLRAECPWDRRQTMKSLRYLTIEEVHELSEAIVAGKADEIRKELGDLAMHILFYCKLAEEAGLFSTADVYNTICEKLIARHPFIYHKDQYHGESWEQLKMRERDHRNVLDGVPDSLPSLVKAVRMQEKVAGMSGEWKAESGEWKEEMNEEEFGDYLFGLVDWARRHGINADDALCGANLRFKKQHENNKPA